MSGTCYACALVLLSTASAAFMVFTASFIIPLLALWLWCPCTSMTWRTRLTLAAITTVLGLFPALLLKAVQTGAFDYTTIARLQVPGGWILSVLLMMAVFLVFRDGTWLLAKLSSQNYLTRLVHAPAVTSFALLFTGTLSALGVFNALQPPKVHEQTLAVRNLPPQLKGLRIAVLADIHASPVNNADYVQTIVNRTLDARPDLIVLPGDMVDGDVNSGRANVAPLAQLRAPLGVWAAPGNHEYYSGYDAWMSELRQLGLKLLENKMQIIPVRGAKLALSGIGDPAYGRTSPYNTDPTIPEGMAPNVDAVANQARKAGAQFHILLAHQPKFAADNAHKNVNLQISGHTHGGLVHGMDQWLVAPVNNGFVRGLYDVGAMKLWVSSGAGLWAGFAIRLGVPPSIDVLTLMPQS